MTSPRYSGPERRQPNNHQTFRIPALLLITAFVVSLLGLAGWINRVDDKKIDKEAFFELKSDVKEIARDVKTLLRGRGNSGVDR